jgi:hypothetical protein
MRRICSWLASIRVANIHRAIFSIIVAALLIFFFVGIIVLCIEDSLWNLLLVPPYFVFLTSSLLVAADFDDNGVLRNLTYNVYMYDDFCKLMDERDILKKERDRLLKLRNVRTI